ncbi:hypothetical protein [Actinomadura flavalba]|uniref:hypothetical protein n=1 Tax=Actinomadura flavalba TaxID=1120938 RepID=UPI00035D2FA2|nr:hypothetical protein [Actinomadura flavalba]
MRRTALLGLSALSALALSAPLAGTAHAAAPVWKVVNGNANNTFTASGPLVIKNASGSLSLTCSPATLAGTVTTRTGTSANIGSLNRPALSDCTDASGAAWQVGSGTSTLSSAINATGYDAAAGRTTLKIEGPWILVTKKSANGCTFQLPVTNGTFTNSTSTLATTTGTVNALGTACSPHVQTGDTVTFQGSFKTAAPISIIRQ